MCKEISEGIKLESNLIKGEIKHRNNLKPQGRKGELVTATESQRYILEALIFLSRKFCEKYVFMPFMHVPYNSLNSEGAIEDIIKHSGGLKVNSAGHAMHQRNISYMSEQTKFIGNLYYTECITSASTRASAH